MPIPTEILGIRPGFNRASIRPISAAVFAPQVGEPRLANAGHRCANASRSLSSRNRLRYLVMLLAEYLCRPVPGLFHVDVDHWRQEQRDNLRENQPADH